MYRTLQLLLSLLFVIFCCGYPFAVIGVAFDVQPPFSMAWAASFLLLLEGSLLIVAAMLVYGWQRGLDAGLLVIVLSYLVEALGASTGYPFGVYRYMETLHPLLPAHVPLPVMFAWVLIVFGAYGWIRTRRGRIGVQGALLGASLATLLDLTIEPVAAHIVHYWQWQSVILSPNYYGVPLTNFAAWFLVAFVLLLLVDTLCGESGQSGKMTLSHVQPLHTWGHWRTDTLPCFIPKLLLCTSLVMFGLVDLTHGYFFAAAIALLTGAILALLLKSQRTREE